MKRRGRGFAIGLLGVHFIRICRSLFSSYDRRRKGLPALSVSALILLFSIRGSRSKPSALRVLRRRQRPSGVVGTFVGRHGLRGRWALPVRKPFGSLFENMPPQVFYGVVFIREFSTCSQLYIRLHPMRHLHGTHGGSGEIKSETLDSRFKCAAGAMTVRVR